MNTDVANVQYGFKLVEIKTCKSTSNMRHPFEKLIEFNNFLRGCNGLYKISLRTDSCLCNAYYRDCSRGTGKPRWLDLSKYLVCRHCILCCNGQSVCTCDSILEWGPEQWYGNIDELKIWLEYYKCDTVVDEQEQYYLCKSHYISMRQVDYIRYVLLPVLANGILDILDKITWIN